MDAQDRPRDARRYHPGPRPPTRTYQDSHARMPRERPGSVRSIGFPPSPLASLTLEVAGAGGQTMGGLHAGVQHGGSGRGFRTGVQDGGSGRGFTTRVHDGVQTGVHDGGSRRGFTTGVHDGGSRRGFTTKVQDGGSHEGSPAATRSEPSEPVGSGRPLSCATAIV